MPAYIFGKKKRTDKTRQAFDSKVIVGSWHIVDQFLINIFSIFTIVPNIRIINSRPTGGGCLNIPPRFFAIAKKTAARSDAVFAQLFGQLLCNFSEKFKSMSPKVRSPGQVKCPTSEKLSNRVTATVVKKKI